MGRGQGEGLPICPCPCALEELVGFGAGLYRTQFVAFSSERTKPVVDTEFDGALRASWDQVRGAGADEIQASVDPVTPTSWAFKDISTTITTVLKDFTSGTKMWIRVRAVGGGSERGPWSDPAAKTVP